MVKELTILGRGPSRLRHPITGEVWAMNDLYKFFPNLDRLFILHNIAYHDGTITGKDINSGDIEDMKALNIPLIGPVAILEHNIQEYPLREILETFNIHNFYMSSIDYMIALAIYEGYEKIKCIGCDFLELDYDHLPAKESVTFWVAFAMGRGIEVTISDGSDILKPRMGKSGNYSRDTYKKDSREYEYLDNIINEVNNLNKQEILKKKVGV